MINLFAVFAQTSQDLGPIGGEKDTGLGPWSWLFREEDVSSAAGIFTDILSRVIGVMTVVAGLFFMFNIFIAAYGFLHAGGSDEKIKQSTDNLLHSIIGLVVVIAAYALISLLGALLGFEILQPGKFIKMLGPK